jgi:hypothetical protein
MFNDRLNMFRTCSAPVRHSFGGVVRCWLPLIPVVGPNMFGRDVDEANRFKLSKRFRDLLDGDPQHQSDVLRRWQVTTLLLLVRNTEQLHPTPSHPV